MPPSQDSRGEHRRHQPKPIAPPPLLDPFLMPDDAWGLTPLDRTRLPLANLASLHNLGLFTPVGETS